MEAYYSVQEQTSDEAPHLLQHDRLFPVTSGAQKNSDDKSTLERCSSGRFCMCTLPSVPSRPLAHGPMVYGFTVTVMRQAEEVGVEHLLRDIKNA